MSDFDAAEYAREKWAAERDGRAWPEPVTAADVDQPDMPTVAQIKAQLEAEGFCVDCD